MLAAHKNMNTYIFYEKNCISVGRHEAFHIVNSTILVIAMLKVSIFMCKVNNFLHSAVKSSIENTLTRATIAS